MRGFFMFPVLFKDNRVWRAYLGGCGISRLKGTGESADTHFPEDWIASCVEAHNAQYRKPGHGLSSLADGTLFPEYLKKDLQKTLGREHLVRFGEQPGFLMKILDSAERLPIQVHPTVADAEKYYNSDHGKTECWVVVSTRKIRGEEPYLLLGFNDTLDETVFRDDVSRGNFSRSENMLHKWNVAPGDVFIVPGGVPHAIGPGVTVIEVMEPSDWVVQPELFCGEQPLTDSDRFGPLTPENAVNIFCFEAETQAEARKRYCPQPVIKNQTADFTLSAIVPLENIKLFEVQQLNGSGKYLLINRERCCRAGVVTDGTFRISTPQGSIEVEPGNSFFLPAAVPECVITGNGKIVFALPQYT